MTNTSHWGGIFRLGNDTSIWRYAGPKATSQMVGVPVLLFLSLNSIPAGFYLDPSQRFHRFVMVIVAFIVAWLFFTIAGKLINHFLPALTAVRVLVISLLFSFTETVRVVSFFNLDTSNALSLVSYDGWFYIPASLAGGLTVMALVSAAVNDSYSYKTSYAALYKQQVILQSKVASVESSVEQTRVNLVQATREMLRKALAGMLSAKASNAESSKLVDELYWVSDELVRPLSHQLYEVPLDVAEEPDIKVPKISMKSFVKSATTYSPFRPVEFTFILFLISVPVSILFPTIQVWFFWLFSIALIFVANYLAQKYCPPLLVSSPLLLRVIFISLVFAVPVMVLGMSSVIPVLLTPGQSGVGLIYGASLALVLGWALALSYGLQYSRREVLNELEETNSRLEWANTRMNSQLWIDQKRLALSLHNDVQSTLLAAAHKLSRSIEKGQKVPAKEIKEVQKVITQSLEFNTRGSINNTLDELVDSLNSTWSSLIMMKCTASKSVAQKLKTDNLAREIVTEILSEFQINSLKHGKATETSVVIKNDGKDRLVVTCTNNGRQLQENISSMGLGEKFLESVTLYFEYSSVKSGTQLRCVIPVDDFHGVASKSQSLSQLI